MLIRTTSRLGVMLPISTAVQRYIPIEQGPQAPIDSGLYPRGFIPPGGSGSPIYSAQPFPPATVPTSDGSTPVTTPPTVVATPTSGPLPTPAAVAAATAPPASLATFLSGSIFGGIPNWVLLLGAGLLLLKGKNS